jgi:P27 family predicted phage terminase small subunit
MKRGTKSVADLSVVALTGARMPAPDHLTDAQAEEWRGIVDSLPADWFRPGDIPLLAAYCMASTFYRQAAVEMSTGGLVKMDDKGREYVNPVHAVLTSQASALAQMAVKLRLCPSARYTEKTAATKTGNAGVSNKPWQTGTNDE